MSVSWVDLGFEVGGVYSNPMFLRGYVWRSNPESFWILESPKEFSKDTPIDLTKPTFADNWCKCFHRFCSAKQVRAFLSDKIPGLGRFSVRSELAVVGKLDGATLNDVQRIFIVNINQLSEPQQALVRDKLRGSNAFILLKR